MSSDELLLSEYKSFHRLVKIAMIAMGLWPLDNPNLFYILLPYLNIVVCLVIIIGILIFVVENVSNLGMVIRGLSVMTSLISVIIKITCFLINHKSAIEMHKILNEYFNRALNNKKIRNVILRDVKLFHGLSWIVTFSAMIVSIVHVLLPILSIELQKKSNIDNVKYTPIYPAIYPWKTSDGGFIYKLNFIFETYGSLLLLFATCSIDTLFSLYLFQIIGYIRMMSYLLPKPDDKKQCQIIIRDCVDPHGTLIKCRNIIQKIYGPIILWMMSTHAIVLCAQIFQISQMKSISIFRGIMLAMYAILKIAQAFLYSWSGTALTYECEKFRSALYDIKWFGKKSIMSSVIIMLNQGPFVVTACHISDVSVKMFLQVLNTTVSYFFLLQTIDGNS